MGKIDLNRTFETKSADLDEEFNERKTTLKNTKIYTRFELEDFEFELKKGFEKQFKLLDEDNSKALKDLNESYTAAKAKLIDENEKAIKGLRKLYKSELIMVIISCLFIGSLLTFLLMRGQP